MKNLLTAVVLSAGVLLGFEYYMAKHAPEATQTVVEQTQADTVAAALTQAAVEPVKNTIAADIPFENELVHGVVNLRGGLPRTLSLKKYATHGTEQTADNQLQLLNGESPFAMKITAGYVAGGMDVPNGDTIWTLAEKGAMTKQAPMVLTYKNATGQSFSRDLYFGADYVLKIEDTVVNGASVPVSVQYMAAVRRLDGQKKNETSSWYNFFGPQGMITGDMVTDSYKKVQKGVAGVMGSGGYWGFSEQYFTVMALPKKDVKTERTFSYGQVDGRDAYTARLEQSPQFVAAGSGTTFDMAFYMGPKRHDDLVAAGYGLETLVDYGWFHIIAAPMFKALKFFHGVLGNWGLAIIALTIVLKIITYPLAAKSYRSMAKMKKIQPEVKLLQEKFKDSGRENMAVEMMALYKKHGVNPMSGCWPMFIQIPIFFAMYKMVLLTFEFRGAPFFGWIQDLSIADPYFVLPVLMGLSMMVQMRLSPMSGDPVQQKVMQFLPVVFTVLFLFFPSGLVLYWLTNNVISVAQQWYMTKDA